MPDVVAQRRGESSPGPVVWDAVIPNHLDWPGCRNARDLGGTPTVDGGVIRPRSLVRTDSLHLLNPDGLRAVRAYAPGRIIDLRRTHEGLAEPNPFADEPVYFSHPVQDPVDPDHEWLELADIYVTMLDLRPELFASAVRAIVEAPEGPVIVHCAAGKDRTGLVVGMALSSVGVTDEEIAADYALTEERQRDVVAARLATITDPVQRETWARLSGTPPKNMLKVLDHLRVEHGGTNGYLAKGGLRPDELDALRDRLVTR